jgi:glycerol-3-phosphate O-acyltransferase
MTASISIPLWVFILLLVVTTWAILDLVFIPSVRWFLRRRINLVLKEIGSRLDIEIRPFQVTKRQVLIDRLVYDPHIIKAAAIKAAEENLPREAIQAEILGYAREIVPSFNAYLYFRLGYWIAKKVAKLLYGVRVGLVDNEELEKVDPNSTVVFVMNHRSNMDYILVAFLAAERTTLSYAVGEWARIWPLHTLIRSMGAFFVRRNSGNPLYRMVLERYIHMATKEGVCQAVFLEGGLSRDGRLRNPKFGLVDYMLRGFNNEEDRDIVFIPVGLNYDRTLEDRSLVRSLDPTADRRSNWFVFRTSLGFIWHNVMLMVLNKWHRFGYACVNFGPCISMKDFCREHGIRFHRLGKEERFPVVEELCRKLMGSIERIVPVLPISVVARTLLDCSDEWLSEFEVNGHIYRLIEDLLARRVPVYLPQRGWDKAISIAFNMVRLRHMVKESDGKFQADPDSLDILLYYANSISQWMGGEEPRDTAE